MYSIVEFHDGIFAIPSIWLSEDKKISRWPPYNNERKILKAVSKKETPEENWKCLNIIRVFGTASDYDSAIKKVSLAEELTDISDIENAKKTRKSRARRVESSSDDSDNESYLLQRKVKETEKTKVTESNIYPEFPTASGIRSPLTNINKNDNAKLTKSDIVQSEKTSMNVLSFTKDLMNIDHTFLTNDEKFDYLIELQKLNIKKGNVILTKLSDLQTRFKNLLDKSVCTNKNKADANDEDENIGSLFRLENIETVNRIEEKLRNKEFYKQVHNLFLTIHLSAIKGH